MYQWASTSILLVRNHAYLFLKLQCGTPPNLPNKTSSKLQVNIWKILDLETFSKYEVACKHIRLYSMHHTHDQKVDPMVLIILFSLPICRQLHQEFGKGKDKLRIQRSSMGWTSPSSKDLKLIIVMYLKSSAQTQLVLLNLVQATKVATPHTSSRMASGSYHIRSTRQIYICSFSKLLNLSQSGILFSAFLIINK